MALRKQKGYLKIGLPLLVTEEGEWAEPRHRSWDEPREGHERVLDDQRGDLGGVSAKKGRWWGGDLLHVGCGRRGQ